jgi:putative SOS response-associated peptidase YedK
MPASQLPWIPLLLSEFLTTERLPTILRYNIAPSQTVPVIVSEQWAVGGGQRKHRREDGEEERRQVALFQWGLVPSWSAPSDSNRGGLINARAETLEDKPSFAESFRTRRCLIPADGFYEWKRSGKWKQPYFFQLQDESQFAFAGIWDRWERDDLSITSCAIITTTPNELLAEIHDRMPAILTAEDQEAWLRNDADPRELKALLAPYPADAMKSFPVSEKVNSALVDEPQLVEPIELQTELRLF